MRVNPEFAAGAIFFGRVKPFTGLRFRRERRRSMLRRRRAPAGRHTHGRALRAGKSAYRFARNAAPRRRRPVRSMFEHRRAAGADFLGARESPPARLDRAESRREGRDGRASPPTPRRAETCGRDARAPRKSAPAARQGRWALRRLRCSRRQSCRWRRAGGDSRAPRKSAPAARQGRRALRRLRCSRPQSCGWRRAGETPAHNSIGCSAADAIEPAAVEARPLPRCQRPRSTWVESAVNRPAKSHRGRAASRFRSVALLQSPFRSVASALANVASNAFPAPPLRRSATDRRTADTAQAAP